MEKYNSYKDFHKEKGYPSMVKADLAEQNNLVGNLIFQGWFKVAIKYENEVDFWYYKR